MYRVVSRRLRLKRFIRRLPSQILYNPLSEVEGNILNYAKANVGLLPGTITNATRGQPGWPGLGRALSLDGSGDVVAFGNSALLNPTSFTWSVIFILPTLHQNGSPRKEFLKRDTPYIFDLNDSGYVEIAVHNGSSYQGMSTNKVSWAAGVPWLVTYVNDTAGGSTGRRIYVNGVLDKAQTAVTPATTTNNLFFGAQDAGATASFNGKLLHHFLIGAPLTDAQVLRLAHKAGFA